MEHSHDSAYLMKQQYQDATNLNVRILIHKRFGTGKLAWNDFIFDNLAIRKGMRVLALGCGNATQWQANQSRFPKSVPIFLTDFSRGMLREARAGLAAGRNFSFACVNAQHLAFADNSFDRVTANHMLYHVPDPGEALAEAARLLKPAGKLMAVTNGSGHMMDLDALLHRFDPTYLKVSSMHSSFSLENGERQIRKHFGQVELVPYECDLWVTDAGLLSAYAFSMPGVKEHFQPYVQPELTAFFEERIQKDGGIRIRKNTGAFLASQPNK